MTAFLVVAALMMTGTLLVVLPPLLARRKAETSDRGAANIELLRRALEDNDAELRTGAIDHGQWESARLEIERRAVEESQVTDGERPVVTENSPRVALLLAVVLPMAAIGGYMVLGEPRAISGMPAAVEAAAGHAAQAEQILAMAEKLAQRLKTNPEDGTGWAMLGRTYAYLGRSDDALNAFEEGIKRLPKDARLLADYADVYAGTKGGGSLAGEPEKLIRRALALDPNQPKALALSGTIAFQKKDFSAAARDWERALAALPDDGEFSKQISAALAEARAALGQTPPKSSGARPAPAAATAVSGTVTMKPELARRASPGDTLFVFAHTPEGAGPPLAVLRATVKELPLKFKLDDSMAMSPGNNLSSATRVLITARVAKSGGVVPQPGDLEGESKPVAPGAAGVAVLIDKVR